MPFFFGILACSGLPVWQRPKENWNYHWEACQDPARSLRVCFSFLHLLIFIPVIKGHRWKVAVSLKHIYSSGADTAHRAWCSSPGMPDVAAGYSESCFVFPVQAWCQSVLGHCIQTGLGGKLRGAEADGTFLSKASWFLRWTTNTLHTLFCQKVPSQPKIFRHIQNECNGDGLCDTGHILIAPLRARPLRQAR